MDILTDALEHSWGKKPEQKAMEKRYNAEYYSQHKEDWKRRRKKLMNSKASNNAKQNANAKNERDKAYAQAWNQEFKYDQKLDQQLAKDAVDPKRALKVASEEVKNIASKGKEMLDDLFSGNAIKTTETHSVSGSSIYTGKNLHKQRK